ncbi:hypothetical protein CHCC20335_3308 [Bacillus paralicheniformis]|nr:hypothetical protein CHCC20335_3308 [Bacillus paralicheniformis]
MTWSYLIIFVVMMFTLLVSGVEHKSGMWPVLLSTPHAKWKHFFVKVILATLLVQLFGLILWLLMGGLGFIFGETFPEPLLYTAFLFALPFVVFQTSASVVVENPYISVSIGMAVFLFHAVLPYWWLPWGPLAELLQAGTQANSLLPVLMLVSTLGYGMLSLLTFYQKTFSSGGE